MTLDTGGHKYLLRRKLSASLQESYSPKTPCAFLVEGRMPPVTLTRKLERIKRDIETILSCVENEDHEQIWSIYSRIQSSTLKIREIISEFANPPQLVVKESIKSAITSLNFVSNFSSLHNHNMSERCKKNLRRNLLEINVTLERALDAIGPFQEPEFIFDPSEFKVTAHVAATALLAQDRHSLTSDPTHYGSGIYALFYNGDLPFYEPIKNTDTPIYVGSASPKKHDAANADEQGSTLISRISDHKRSIQCVQSSEGGNLSVADFDYRCLVVSSGWELAAEMYLIRFFKPVWNKEVKICTGFGKHGDSSETRGNRKSLWDTIHPGRHWASNSPDNARSPADIYASILGHFETHPPRTITIENILHG